MKCAREMMELRVLTILEEEKRQAILREERKAESIRLCDEYIDKAMESRIKDLKNYNFSIELFFESVGTYGVIPVEKERMCYSDGSPSHVPVKDWHVCDVEVITEILTNHCYKVEWDNTFLRHWGIGEYKAKRLKVSIE